MHTFKAALGLILTAIFMSGCGKETASVTTDRPADYLNLVSGKYIIYQLDSLVKSATNDTAFETHSYQAKDVMDTIVLDGTNRPSWRVYRYLRALNSTNEADWTASDTYLVTPTSANLEVVENNLRYLKLAAPLSTGETWMGNRYIAATPGSELEYLQAWQYSITDINNSFAPFETPIDSCITILQTDEGSGYADDRNPVSVDLDGYRTYSIEVYAKHIGLVYKNLVYWTFQKRSVDNAGNPSNPYPNGNKEGGGIRLRMISHN